MKTPTNPARIAIPPDPQHSLFLGLSDEIAKIKSGFELPAPQNNQGGTRRDAECQEKNQKEAPIKVAHALDPMNTMSNIRGNPGSASRILKISCHFLSIPPLRRKRKSLGQEAAGFRSHCFEFCKKRNAPLRQGLPCRLSIRAMRTFCNCLNLTLFAVSDIISLRNLPAVLSKL